jgi:hypothetical protein
MSSMERSLPASQATAACARVSANISDSAHDVVIVMGALPKFPHPCCHARALQLHVADPHAKAFVGGNLGQKLELERCALWRIDGG